MFDFRLPILYVCLKTLLEIYLSGLYLFAIDIILVEVLSETVYTDFFGLFWSNLYPF